MVAKLPETPFASRWPTNLRMKAKRAKLIAAFRERIQMTHDRLLLVPSKWENQEEKPVKYMTRWKHLCWHWKIIFSSTQSRLAFVMRETLLKQVCFWEIEIHDRDHSEKNFFSRKTSCFDFSQTLGSGENFFEVLVTHFRPVNHKKHDHHQESGD